MLLQKAMNLYVDSGTGKNLEKVEAYVRKLAGQKKLTNREKQQLDVMDRMLNMTDEERAWADDRIRPYYEDLFKFAQENKLIDTQIDNYVKRSWKMRQAKRSPRYTTVLNEIREVRTCWR